RRRSFFCPPAAVVLRGSFLHMRRASRRRPRRSPWRGTVGLALVFAGLVAVNAYFFFFRRGTSVNDLVRLSENRELAAAVAPVPKRPARPVAARPVEPPPVARPAPRGEGRVKGPLTVRVAAVGGTIETTLD